MSLTIYPKKDGEQFFKGYISHRDESESTKLEFAELRFALSPDKKSATVYIVATAIAPLNVKEGTGKEAKTNYKVSPIPTGMEMLSFSVGKGDKETNSEKALAAKLATLDSEKTYKGFLKLGSDPIYDMYIAAPDGDASKIIDFYLKLEETEAGKLAESTIEFRENKGYSQGGYSKGQTEKECLQDRFDFINDQMKKAGQTPFAHIGEMAEPDISPQANQVLIGFGILSSNT